VRLVGSASNRTTFPRLFAQIDAVRIANLPFYLPAKTNFGTAWMRLGKQQLHPVHLPWLKTLQRKMHSKFGVHFVFLGIRTRTMS
jgi:hypothetical protein